MGTYPVKLEGQDLWAIWQSTTEVFFEPTFRNEAFAERVAKQWCSLGLIEMDKDVNLNKSMEVVKKQIKDEIGFDPDTNCPIDDKDQWCESCEHLVNFVGYFKCDIYKYATETDNEPIFPKSKKTCPHPPTEQVEQNLGRCYNKVTCRLCGRVVFNDSSD